MAPQNRHLLYIIHLSLHAYSSRKWDKCMKGIAYIESQGDIMTSEKEG
jgi:hypothetical protein